MELTKKKLAELSDTMFESMEHIGYAKRTIGAYRLVYRKFAEYAAENDCLYLTQELADGFIAEFAARHPEDSTNGIIPCATPLQPGCSGRTCLLVR